VSHPASGLQHVFVADCFGKRELHRAIWIEHDLHQSATVAQINKDHPTMVAAALHPAAQTHFLLDERLVNISTQAGSQA